MSVEPLRGRTREIVVNPNGITSLSPYAANALEEACRAIRSAPEGAQTSTLQGQARVIGFLAGIRAIGQDFAIAALLDAGAELAWRDPPEEMVSVILVAFNLGLQQGWRHIGLKVRNFRCVECGLPHAEFKEQWQCPRCGKITKVSASEKP